MAREGSITRVARSFSQRSPIFWTIVVLLAVSAFLFWRGYTFYTLGLERRVGHEDFRVLSPGAPIGHGYGIVGTALILTNLLYLARRRVARFNFGSMQAWLNMHVLSPVSSGALLILFHSAFQLRTPIATVTSSSLLLVVITGVVGRYLHAIAPRPDPRRMAELIEGLEALGPGLGSQARDVLRAVPPTQLAADAGLLKALVTIPRWLLESRKRRRAVRAVARNYLSNAELNAQEKAAVRSTAREAAGAAAAQVRAEMGAAVLRSWRGLHRFLALLMLVSVSVHIGVAWYYGYRWIWSE